ncbi:hypothetical protein GCM10027295_11380 [Pseudaeromonas pectinilytica]
MECNGTIPDGYRVRVQQRLGIASNWHAELTGFLCHDLECFCELYAGLSTETGSSLACCIGKFSAQIRTFFRQSIKHRPTCP